MIQNYDYTKIQMEQLINTMVILIDTREKNNKHIIDYLVKHNYSYKKEKLNYGDYSFILPANKELGIIHDITFKNSIVIERKANLEELSNNLTHKRSEFENELIRGSKAKMYLLIENSSYKDIVNHNYNTKYEPKSYIGTLKTYETRFNLDVNFLGNECSGNFIYYTFKYYLREFLKG
jgi:hypothetical protein